MSTMPTTHRERRRRLTRVAGSVVPLTLAVALLTACDPADPDADPAGTAWLSSSPSPTTDPTPTTSPTTAPTPTPTATPTRSTVALTTTGVGPLLDGSPVELSDVEALLGPADSHAPDLCAPESLDMTWGGLTVTTVSGLLYGWAANRSAPLPASVSVPGDVIIGTPLSAVLAMPGVGAPAYDDSFGLWMTTVGTYPASLIYVTDSDAADSPVVTFGHNPVVCG